jgi:hypothetical protein
MVTSIPESEPLSRSGSSPNSSALEAPAIYGGLPSPRVPENLLSELVEQIDSGNWDAIREAEDEAGSGE